MKSDGFGVVKSSEDCMGIKKAGRFCVLLLIQLAVLELEAVADTEGDVTPVEVNFGEEVDARTDVEGQLDGDVEFQLQTSLASEGESDVAVVGDIIVPVAEVGTKTGKPAEGTEAEACEIASPLIDTSEVESGEVVACVVAEVEFEAVAAEAVLPGEFSVVTLTAAEADTEVVLCVGSHRKDKDCGDS